MASEPILKFDPLCRNHSEATALGVLFGENMIRQCEVCGSYFPVRLFQIKKGHGRFCNYKCFAAWAKGKVFRKFHPNKAKHNPDGTTIIMLTRGESCIIDSDDYGLVKNTRWHATNNRGHVYVCSGGRKNRAIMTRVLMNPEKHLVVDHINGNTLDNRRANLRVCTHKQNLMNSPAPKNSRFKIKGVYFHARLKSKPWSVDFRKKRIGYFATAQEAAIIYNAKAKEVYGEFAYQNKVIGGL